MPSHAQPFLGSFFRYPCVTFSQFAQKASTLLPQDPHILFNLLDDGDAELTAVPGPTGKDDWKRERQGTRL